MFRVRTLLGGPASLHSSLLSHVASGIFLLPVFLADWVSFLSACIPSSSPSSLPHILSPSHSLSSSYSFTFNPGSETVAGGQYILVFPELENQFSLFESVHTGQGSR